MNWTCNCSLYNTLVLLVYIILLSERSSERWSRGIRRDYLAFLAHVSRGAFDRTLVAGHSATRTLDGIRGNKQFWSNLNCKFEFFYGKTYCRGGSRLNRPYKQVFVGAAGNMSRSYKSICRGGLGTAPTNA